MTFTISAAKMWNKLQCIQTFRKREHIQEKSKKHIYLPKRGTKLVHMLTIGFLFAVMCGGSVVSTRMLLSSHYLHDYSDFYSDFGINNLHTFV